jgi:hypothetical protein
MFVHRHNCRWRSNLLIWAYLLNVATPTLAIKAATQISHFADKRIFLMPGRTF